MLELDKIKDEFINYTNKFDKNDSRIKEKVGHTFRVADACYQIAKNINLEKEEIEISYLIGILHDIGRFKQLRDYDTFSDEQMDHANFGVELLKKSDYIRRYIKDDKYDTIIYKAIENHNKYKVDINLNNREMLFTKIIRDADKIDIFNGAIWMMWKNRENEVTKDSKITPKIYNQFLKNKMLIYDEECNLLDEVIYYIAMLFDINYKISFEIIKENDYINKILDRFEFEQKQEIKDICSKYIEEQLKSDMN